MIRFCKESPSTITISGKPDYFAPPHCDTKSVPWEYFTDDGLRSDDKHLVGSRETRASSTGCIGIAFRRDKVDPAALWIERASPRACLRRHLLDDRDMGG